MTEPLKIDFVSDVVCPWCAVGLGALDEALRRLDGHVQADVHFQPFELNPQMAPEGEDVVDHLVRKYGSTPEEMSARWQQLCERAEAVGYHFKRERGGRIWNTFDAHRLLHWAGVSVGPAAQRGLKQALLRAYHEQQAAIGHTSALLAAVAAAGLDAAQAAAILAGDTYAAEVRERQAFYAQAGIRAVPSVIINDQYLLQGGQPPEAFEQALREIATEASGSRRN